MKRERTLTMEAPDDIAVIDFLPQNEKRKADRRGCVVRLSVENGALFVQVIGSDDRATILADEKYDLPKADKRR